MKNLTVEEAKKYVVVMNQLISTFEADAACVQRSGSLEIVGSDGDVFISMPLFLGETAEDRKTTMKRVLHQAADDLLEVMIRKSEAREAK